MNQRLIEIKLKKAEPGLSAINGTCFSMEFERICHHIIWESCSKVLKGIKPNKVILRDDFPFTVTHIQDIKYICIRTLCLLQTNMQNISSLCFIIFLTSKKNLFWFLSLREPYLHWSSSAHQMNSFRRTHRGKKIQILILLAPISLDSFHLREQPTLGCSESHLHQGLSF